MKSHLYYVYFASGLMIGLALVGISLARGLLVGVIAGVGWSGVCVVRLVTGHAKEKALPSKSGIARWRDHRRSGSGPSQ